MRNTIQLLSSGSVRHPRSINKCVTQLPVVEASTSFKQVDPMERC